MMSSSVLVLIVIILALHGIGIGAAPVSTNKSAAITMPPPKEAVVESPPSSSSGAKSTVVMPPPEETATVKEVTSPLKSETQTEQPLEPSTIADRNTNERLAKFIKEEDKPAVEKTKGDEVTPSSKTKTKTHPHKGSGEDISHEFPTTNRGVHEAMSLAMTFMQCVTLPSYLLNEIRIVHWQHIRPRYQRKLLSLLTHHTGHEAGEEGVNENVDDFVNKKHPLTVEGAIKLAEALNERLVKAGKKAQEKTMGVETKDLEDLMYGLEYSQQAIASKIERLKKAIGSKQVVKEPVKKDEVVKEPVKKEDVVKKEVPHPQ